MTQKLFPKVNYTYSHHSTIGARPLGMGFSLRVYLMGTFGKEEKNSEVEGSCALWHLDLSVKFLGFHLYYK